MDLRIALEVAVAQRDWGAGSPDFDRVQWVHLHGRLVDRSSRAALVEWGAMAADLTPSPNAPRPIELRVERMAREGRAVQRACR